MEYLLDVHYVMVNRFFQNNIKFFQNINLVIFFKTLFLGELHMTVFVILFTLMLTINMIYGAIKGKPKMLIPFFCMQLFDLFVTM